MKTFRFIKMALLAILMCTGFSACTSDDYEVLPDNSEEYIVSVGCAGEILDIKDSPLSRAVSNDLYGIQVYTSPTDKTEYVPYAYTLVDDPSNLTISLKKGYKYKFVSTVVIDGKNKLSKSDSNGYSQPFGITDGFFATSSPINSAFVYSNKHQMTGMKSGTSDLKVSGSTVKYSRPNTDRYYGELSEYIPTDNGSVNILMKRTSFGAKFVATNFEEGKLKIMMEGAPDTYLEYPNTQIQDIFTFANCNMAFENGGLYTEDIPLTINSVKPDGTEVTLATKSITFKRNKLTTITIKLASKSSDNTVGFELETEEMGDGGNENIEEGSNGKIQWVDLGLPSGIKWANVNIGANSPEEFGDFFAWGETRTKSSYDQSNSLTFGKPMSCISGNPQYDAATVIWGAPARIPKHSEMKELEDNCKLTWSVQNDVKGLLVTGTNGNSIFLPAAGHYYGTTFVTPGDRGTYWSADPSVGEQDRFVIVLDFYYANGYNWTFGWSRSDGHTIRPVRD